MSHASYNEVYNKLVQLVNFIFLFETCKCDILYCGSESGLLDSWGWKYWRRCVEMQAWAHGTWPFSVFSLLC